MASSSGWRVLVVAGLGLLAGAASIAATEPVKVPTPIVAAADAASPKRDADRNVLRTVEPAGGVDIEPLTLAFAGLGVGVLLLLRRIER